MKKLEQVPTSHSESNQKHALHDLQLEQKGVF